MVWLAAPTMPTESVADALGLATADTLALAGTFTAASWLGEACILLGGALVVSALVAAGLAVA